MARTCVAIFSLLLCVEATAAVNIGVILDTARATSAVIGTAGGTLNATAVNGTVFTLTIPQNALANDETITMTPVSQTTNLPFSGGMAAAVQLEPSGLRLFQMATLTIAMPTPIPPQAETPLAWHAGGSDMYLHPLLIDPTTTTFKLIHFSGVGVANGTDAERTAQENRIPCDIEGTLSQRLVPVLEVERQGELLGQPSNPNLNEELVEVLTDYYNFSIRPMMAVALQSKDEDILYSAILRALGTIRQLQLFLNDKDLFLNSATEELSNFIAQALQIWSDNAFDLCIHEHKIEQLMEITQAERIAQLFFGTSIDLGTQQKLDQCGSFELVFETTMHDTAFAGLASGTYTMHATARV